VGNVTSLLPLIVLAALFYLLLIRPQKNRQRQAQALLSKLSAGDRVITSSGMYGTVVLVDGDDVEVEVFPDVDIRLVKGAIQRILPPEEGTGELEGGDPEALDSDILGSDLRDSDLRDDERDDSVPVVRPPGGRYPVPGATDPATDAAAGAPTSAPTGARLTGTDDHGAPDTTSPGTDRR